MRTRVHLSARPGPIVAAAVCAVLATLAGCSQFDVKPVWPWSTAKDDKPQAGRMTVAWTHATEVEGGREVRGFRGRISLPQRKSAATGKKTDPEHEQPIKVEGTLTVYAFDVTAEGKLTSVAPRTSSSPNSSRKSAATRIRAPHTRYGCRGTAWGGRRRRSTSGRGLTESITDRW